MLQPSPDAPASGLATARWLPGEPPRRGRRSRLNRLLQRVERLGALLGARLLQRVGQLALGEVERLLHRVERALHAVAHALVGLGRAGAALVDLGLEVLALLTLLEAGGVVLLVLVLLATGGQGQSERERTGDDEDLLHATISAHPRARRRPKSVRHDRHAW